MAFWGTGTVVDRSKWNDCSVEILPTGEWAVSREIQRWIYPTGGEIVIGGCSVTFPSGAFNYPTVVRVKAEIDSSKWPENFTACTPALYVDAPCFPKVRLQSWYRLGNNEKSRQPTVRIIHFLETSKEWEYTGKNLPSSSVSFFDFEWLDFSPVIGGVWNSFGANMPVEVRSSIYASDTKEYSLVYHIDSDLVTEGTNKRMRERKIPLTLLETFDDFKAGMNDEFEATLLCTNHGRSQFHPSSTFRFSVGEDLRKNKPIIYDVYLSAKIRGWYCFELEHGVTQSGREVTVRQAFTNVCTNGPNQFNAILKI